MSKEIVYWKQRNGELISISSMDINHHFVIICKYNGKYNINSKLLGKS